jgi:hypothetical protein
LAEAWAFALPLLLPAIEMAGTHWPADVLDTVIAGATQLWTGERSALVTEIVVYPRLKACNIWLAGGDLKEVVEIQRSVAEGAKARGCARLEVRGRPGWLRTERGIRVAGSYLVRDI